MPLLLGLLSWILIGLAAGLSAARMLPGEPPLGFGRAALAGLAGALAGGLLATGLGFGGLAGFDLRAFATAALGSVCALLALRHATLAH